MLKQQVTLQTGECREALYPLQRAHRDFATGQAIQGSFHCKKSNTNSRELDVEIHWSVKDDKGADVGTMQYDVFRVC
jgi:hypothetical protein